MTWTESNQRKSERGRQRKRRDEIALIDSYSCGRFRDDGSTRRMKAKRAMRDDEELLVENFPALARGVSSSRL